MTRRNKGIHRVATALTRTGTALATSVAFSVAAEAQAWEDPRDRFGPGWGCASMSVGNPTYDTCKKCDASGGRFYWRMPNRDVGRCVQRDPEPAARAPSDDDDDFFGIEPDDNSTSDDDVYASPRPSRPAAPATPTSYGAVAVSTKTLSWGAAWNSSSRSEAETKAMNECRQHASDCQIGVWVKNGCFALATGSVLGGLGGTQWGAAWAADESGAKSRARSECSKRGMAACGVKVARCMSR